MLKNHDFEIPEIDVTARLVELPSVLLRNAVTGEPADLSTRLRLAFRGGRLLIRFDCRHRGIVATLRHDNEPLWTEDVVEAFVAFESDSDLYTELEVNPLGAKFSARISSPNLGREGMGVETFEFAGFTAVVRRRESSWSALMRIPLLRAPFRANFFRIDRTSGEFQALCPTLADPPDFHRPDFFARFNLKSSRR